MTNMLAALLQDMAIGTRSAGALAEHCLDRIAEPGGEGGRAFIAIEPAKVRAQAAAIDLLRKHGIAPGPLAGLCISLKDLFDVAGEVTRAGSIALADAPPARQDAAIVARLRAAGAVITGRTNMTEFAYGGIGFNPHYGTPAAPWDRATGRVPGGSSAGAAVSVADGMAHAAIGTDTGGSCRIPAAFCGIVGYKPTAARVPLAGCYPLAPSLDSIGPLAPSVACAALIDAVLAGEEPVVPEPMPVAGLRLLAPTNYVLDAMEKPVAEAYGAALSRLSGAGARITEGRLGVLERMPDLFEKGGIGAAECHAHHAPLIAEKGQLYDPKVRVRMEVAATQSSAGYQALLRLRRQLCAELDSASAPYDAIVMPTVPILPPPIGLFGDHQSFADYNRLNGLTLRNTAIANQLDRCAISLPCHAAGAPPVGLMLVGERMGDRRLFAIAAGIEALLGNASNPL